MRPGADLILARDAPRFVFSVVADAVSRDVYSCQSGGVLGEPDDWTAAESASDIQSPQGYRH